MSESLFVRLLADDDKETALNNAIASLHDPSSSNSKVYTANPDSFRQVPGSPFAYWVSDRIRQLFTELPPFESEGRTVQHGLSTKDDFRFICTWWEVVPERIVTGTAETTPEEFCQQTFEGKHWVPFAKGGEYSPFYSDLHLVVNWECDGSNIEEYVIEKYPCLRGNASWILHRECNYFRPGVTWSRSTNKGLSVRCLNSGVIFADKGLCTFVVDDNRTKLKNIG